jgi:2,3-dihydro-2,3-dihydroxybenzoate dehydrogenase
MPERRKGDLVTQAHGLAGKTAMVTGAAGGIGTAITRALAARGAVVAAADHDVAGLGELTGKLAADGLPVSEYQVDVTDGEAVQAAVGRIEEQAGPIHILVNAAGILRTGSAAELSDADWRATFAVNLGGVVHCSRAVAARMRERHRGSIVTVASNACRVPRMQMVAYGAAKAAAVYFTKTLGLELAGHGIRCNVVSPGSTDTAMLRSLWSGHAGREETIRGSADTFKLGIPLGRIADPGDIAEAVLFLASDQARHITMQDLCVDGGALLGA